MMKATGRRYKSPLILVFILSFFALPMISGMQAFSVASSNPVFKPSQTPHGPIAIISNADFAAQAASEIWPGSGQLFDPYIISGLSIIHDLTCISIENVDVYFVIRDCYLESVWGGDRYGINIENSQHGTIEDCTIRRAGRGINIIDSSDIVIENNNVGGSMRRGISVLQSSFCEVSENTVHGNEDGIAIQFSTDCIVRFNDAYQNYESGFYIYQSEETILYNNTSGYQTDHGFKVEYSINCTLSRNIASDNDLDGFILNSSSTCVLTSNTAEYNQWGFSSGDSSGCTLDGNVAHHNSIFGFILHNSPGFVLENNVAYRNSDTGFQLDASQDCLLEKNQAYNNSGMGFEVLNVNSGEIHDNEAFFNGQFGFYFYNADNVLVSLNIGRNNQQTGFVFSGPSNSDNCEVIRNVAMNNGEYGFYFTSMSSSNSIHWNLIGWNGIGNAVDNGTLNVWDDDVSIGNAWSDYGGTGTYPVPGSAGAVDRYPITGHLSPPSIDSPDDIEYYVGEVGNRIEWASSSITPRIYQILRNGTLVDSGDWNGSALAFNVDGLSFGTHNFTLQLYDIFGNVVSDTVLVIVSVESPITEIFGIPTEVLTIVGIGAVILVVAIIIQRNKELYD